MPSGYREQRAPSPLTGVVACLWRDGTDTPREQRVLPDGCIDLVWMHGEVHVAGPDTAAYVVSLDAGQALAGLRFLPGAAPAVLGMPAAVLRDQRVPLREIWPGSALAERVAAAPDPAAALAEAVAPAGADAAAGASAVRVDPALRVVLARLRAGCGVAATADALGWTERTLHRRCRDAFGYGPAVLRRILRFRAALRLAEQGTPFAAVAARAGYADQSHLAREVRALADVPLGRLVAAQPGSGANRSTPTPSGSSTVA